MEREEIISCDKKVMNGAIVFTGTRVPVEILVQHLKAGDPLSVFLDDFPSVKEEQAKGFLEIALEFTQNTIFYIRTVKELNKETILAFGE